LLLHAQLVEQGRDQELEQEVEQKLALSDRLACIRTG
jgi:hypothetical protein